MKTTIDLPDATFRQVKTVAAARGMTLKRFLTEALEAARTWASRTMSSSCRWLGPRLRQA